MLLSGNRDDLLIQFLISNRNIGNLRRTGRSGCRLRRRSGRFLRSLLLRLVRCYRTGRIFSSVLSAFIWIGRNNFHLKLFFRCFRFICRFSVLWIFFLWILFFRFCLFLVPEVLFFRAQLCLILVVLFFLWILLFRILLSQFFCIGIVFPLPGIKIALLP